VALTVAQVAALPDLGLIVRTASAPLDREVRWVAVSEHLDPTPWLAGGDLLLTTGMAITDDPDQAADYVDRLLAAEAAGIGFGVGLSHAAIPEALVARAESVGLPVVEVPQPVPFVAVSMAVSRLLNAEEYAESAASFECQRRLIRAALTDTPGRTDELLAVLAKHLRGFCLHLDARGQVIAASPPSAAGRAPDLLGEIERLRPRGLLASSSVSSADEHIVVVPVGVKGVADGFLVVGSDRPARAADQAVVNVAVSLVSWEMSRPVARDEGMDPWRRLLVGTALADGLRPELLEDLGLTGLPAHHASALVLRAPAGRSVSESTLSELARIPGVLACRRGADLVAFCAVDDDGRPPDEVLALAGGPEVSSLGVSCALDLTDAANVRQAVDQAERAAVRGPGLQVFDEEPSRGLASLIDAATTATWARGYLGDLVTVAEGPELMSTLRAWLDQHGQVDAAAQQLGIHRHTVRHRIRRAEAVLGRSLDDPGVRADLWFALNAIVDDTADSS
jgi:purine catabolism regulator